MQPVGPITLAFGVASTQDDPQQTLGNSSANCQVQNSSSFVLTILALGDVLTIQPFTAQTIAVGGQPIIITPSQNSGSGVSAAEVTLVWLLAGEGPPMQDGPLTAAAVIASAINPIDVLDVIASITVPAVGGGAATVSGLTAGHSYQTIGVQFANASVVGTCVVVKNTTKGTSSGPQLVWQPAVSGLLIFAQTLYFPIACQPGDQIEIDLYSTSVAGNAIGVVVLGFGVTVQPTPLRGDGRSRPQSSQQLLVPGNNSSGTTGAPCRYLVGGITIEVQVVGGSPGNADVSGTLNGAAGTTLFIAPTTTLGSWSKRFDEGVLLDPSSAMTLTVPSGTNAFAVLDVDVMM